MGPLLWLTSVMGASAAPHPLTLAPQLPPSQWEEDANQSGFVLAPATDPPGCELIVEGDVVIVVVRNDAGETRRVSVPLPTSSQQRQALLAIAADLLRPSPWPTSTPPPPPTVQTPPVAPEKAAIPAAKLTPEALPPEALAPEKLTPIATTFPPHSAVILPQVIVIDVAPPDLMPASAAADWWVRAGTAAAWRGSVSPQVSLELSARRLHRSVWWGVSGRWQSIGDATTRVEMPDTPFVAVTAQTREWIASGGAGVQRQRGRVRPEIGLWGQLTARQTLGACFDCNLTTEQRLDPDQTGSGATLSYLERSGHLIPGLSLESAAHVPVGSKGLSVSPFAGVSVDLASTVVPGVFGYDELKRVQVRAGVAVSATRRQK
ncbi:MAG: hypothetical protein AAFV53_43165 [Myxococcota bacterium]